LLLKVATPSIATKLWRSALMAYGASVFSNRLKPSIWLDKILSCTPTYIRQLAILRFVEQGPLWRCFHSPQREIPRIYTPPRGQGI
jgi:hypothetical protein